MGRGGARQEPPRGRGLGGAAREWERRGAGPRCCGRGPGGRGVWGLGRAPEDGALARLADHVVVLPERQQLGEAEVRDLHMRLALHQDVSRSQVAVHAAARAQVLHALPGAEKARGPVIRAPRLPTPNARVSGPSAPGSAGPHLADLPGEQQQAAGVQARAVALQEVPQAAAGQVLHHQPQALATCGQRQQFLRTFCRCIGACKAQLWKLSRMGARLGRGRGRVRTRPDSPAAAHPAP